METKKIVLPDGWEIDKVNGNEIILKEGKKELPKTWEGCCKELKVGEFISTNSEIYVTDSIKYANAVNKNKFPKGLAKPMLALMQLLVCREVYRQGWKPDWSTNGTKYIIVRIGNCVHADRSTSFGSILSFQTAEIRDKFLDNFRDLIEEAKELI